MSCNMCQKTNLTEFLDLGLHPLVNSLVSEDDRDRKENINKLALSYCNDCHLVQLSEHVDSKKIYKDVDYLFFSSDMPTLSDYFKDFARGLYEDKYLSKSKRNKDGSFDPAGLFVEIGSNDGVLLQHIEGPKLGVDPSLNVTLRALHNYQPTIPEFFTEDVAKKILKEYGKAQVIAGFNCVAHTDDLVDLMKGVELLLNDEGVFVVEANYWGNMIKNKNYALIYHDHFNFFTLEVWERFLYKFGLKVFDVEITPAQGGSLRLFISKAGSRRQQTARLNEARERESAEKMNDLETCRNYTKDVKEMQTNFRTMIRGLKAKGKKLALYGVAAKGLTVLTYTGMGTEYFDYGVDDSPAKQGYFTPVSHIPIISRAEATRRGLPDYFIVLAYNYIDVIKNKEEKFLRDGGHLINIMTLGVI